MTKGRKLIIGGAVLVALGAGGVGLAQAVGGDDEQATGPEAERAKAAAVKTVGGGRAVGVEREDEGSAAWEVEVKQADGSTVEVHLTGDLQRSGVERDDDGRNTDEKSDND
jgi:peptidase YpeB-like protein